MSRKKAVQERRDIIEQLIKKRPICGDEFPMTQHLPAHETVICDLEPHHAENGQNHEGTLPTQKSGEFRQGWPVNRLR